MLGGGGHAEALEDVVDSIRDYSISMAGRVRVAYKVKDTREINDEQLASLALNFSGFILGVGQVHDASVREGIVERVKDVGGTFATLISPFARVSPKARIGHGTVIMHNASVNSGAAVGEFCIVNTGAIIEHNAWVYPYCHISTGAVINGDCKVGCRSFIGSNAVLLNQIEICPDTMIGAGSVVTQRITEPGGIYVGNHAKFLRYKN